VLTVAGVLAADPTLDVSAEPEPDVSELDVPEPDVPEPDVSFDVPDPDEPDELVVDVVEVLEAPVFAAAEAVLRDSAGSCPDASWMKIVDQKRTNSASEIAITRRRMSDTRCLRARRRCAASRAPSRGAPAAAGRGGGEEGVGEVIAVSLGSKTLAIDDNGDGTVWEDS
jgi:hypothetical protein